MKQYNYYIITGGPGSGKTTLLDELRSKGYHCVDEVARQIIKEQTSINGDALHTKNQAKFCDLMLSRTLLTYNENLNEGSPVIFDRGLPDLIGYCKLIGIEAPEYLQNAVNEYRYNKRVFIAPPWEDIYTHDDERVQGWEEAVKTYECIAEAYINHGYELLELPKDTLMTRIDFIEKKLLD